MDRTKEYQRMCKAALEIQEKWDRLPGDYVYNIAMEEIIIFNRQTTIPEYTISYTTEGHSRTMTNEEWCKSINIWIPRQDQLQDMIIVPHTHENKPEIMHKLDTLNAWMHAHKPGTYQFTSGEQLWIAFVMLLNYNKAWDGKEWAIQVNPNQ